MGEQSLCVHPLLGGLLLCLDVLRKRWTGDNERRGIFAYIFGARYRGAIMDRNRAKGHPYRPAAKNINLGGFYLRALWKQPFSGRGHHHTMPFGNHSLHQLTT